MNSTALEKQQPLPAIPERSAIEPTEMVGMFERLATNPAVPVEKLEKLIELQERIMRHDAKAAFDAAFAEMQGEIPEITERGEISVNGQVRSKYAKFEDILREVKPILTKHGFAIRHRNVFDNGTIKIVGILSHRSGHSEEDEFVAKADDSGSKNAIQALGSTRSYGQRYTTISLLNIATRGADDDGHTSVKATAPKEPTGYDVWLEGLEDVSAEGLPRLTATFNESKREFRQQLTIHDAHKWQALKARAAKVGAK